MDNNYLNIANQLDHLDLEFQELNINIYDNSFLYNNN